MKKYYLYENKIVVYCNKINVPFVKTKMVKVKYLNNKNRFLWINKNRLKPIPKNKVGDYLMASEV